MLLTKAITSRPERVKKSHSITCKWRDPAGIFVCLQRRLIFSICLTQPSQVLSSMSSPLKKSNGNETKRVHVSPSRAAMGLIIDFLERGWVILR